MRTVYSKLASICACLLFLTAALAAQSVDIHYPMLVVKLGKTLDSKKLKVGDPVMAKLSGPITLPNGSVIPMDSEMWGHVTQVTARSKGAPDSTLSVIFDKLIRPKGGEATPMHGVVRAAGPDPDQMSTSLSSVDYGNNLKTSTTNNAGFDIAPPAPPMLNDNSTGVMGIKNLKLDDAGVFSSPGKDIKLPYGTSLLIKAEIDYGRPKQH